MKTRRIIDKRVKEKFMVDDAYLNGFAAQCGWNATLVYIELCRHVDKEQTCFPSIQHMAEKLGISPNSVKRGIKALKAWNIIDIKRVKWKNGTWKNNTYILLDKSVWIKENSQVPVRDVETQEPVSPKPGASEGLDQEPHGDTKETHNEGNKFNETHKKNKRKYFKDSLEIKLKL